MNPSGQFDPLFARYGHDYTEGNAWQYTWFVPHDMYGLIGLMGGKERFAKRLDTLFTLVAGQDEDAPHDITGLIGQYAHGNEPSHHVAYLYAFADKPWKTQERVRKIMDELYTLGPKGLPGNEDCGQMSAWYILSAMGFYPVNPAGGILRAGLPGAGRSKYPFGKWTCFFDKNERFFA
jgi:predicted alpha-1,2-mannosidase